MLKLKELKFSGIGRFTEEQKIVFTDLGNLIQVDGQNNNTGGSSGSGKTTIFNALDYLLGLNEVPNTVLQSRLTKDSISVTGAFDLDGKDLKISRIKGKLSVDIDGDLTVGSSKLSEEKLDEIMAMPRHLFRPMLHKRQKEGGFFLQFTPKDMNEFLTDCLGLGEYRLKLEIIEKNIKELTEKTLKDRATLDSFKAAHQSTCDALDALGPSPVRDIDRDTIVALKTKSDASLTALIALENEYKASSAELDKKRPSAQFPAYDNTTLNAHQKALNDLHTQLSAINMAEKERQAGVQKQIYEKNFLKTSLAQAVNQGEIAKAEAKTAMAQLQKVRDSICPTCEQNWSTENAKKTEAILLTNISLYKEKITHGMAAATQIIKITEEIEALKLDLNLKLTGVPEINTQIGNFAVLLDEEKSRAASHHQENGMKVKVLLDSFAAKQQELLQKYSQAISQSRGQADMDRRVLESAIAQMKNHEEMKNRHDATKNTLHVQEQAHKKKIEELALHIIGQARKLEMAEELKKAIKTYISYSFDDALEIIGDTATRIIRSIPNMSNATLQLEGTKETKEGKIKEEVNASISIDGDIAVPIKSLSGGERSSVDLAVDLAVIDLIENKTGKGIDIFIMDEPFTGLDTISIEMAIEVLKNANINKKLIIVDHNPIIAETIDTKILVIREKEKSHVSQ